VRQLKISNRENVGAQNFQFAPNISQIGDFVPNFGTFEKNTFSDKKKIFRQAKIQRVGSAVAPCPRHDTIAVCFRAVNEVTSYAWCISRRIRWQQCSRHRTFSGAIMEVLRKLITIARISAIMSTVSIQFCGKRRQICLHVYRAPVIEWRQTDKMISCATAARRQVMLLSFKNRAGWITKTLKPHSAPSP